MTLPSNHLSNTAPVTMSFLASGADIRDAGNADLSQIRNELDRNLFLFCHLIMGNYWFTPEYHGPICEFLGQWGKPGFKRLGLCVPRDVGKCVSPDDLASTPSGPRRVGDLLPGDELWALDDNFNLTLNRVVANQPSTAPLLKITTRTGISYRVTHNHPVLTVLGWKRADTLIPGDGVATASSIPAPTPTGPWPYWAGVLAGDACLQSPGGCRVTPRLTCCDPEIVETLESQGVKVRHLDPTTYKLPTFSFHADQWKQLPATLWHNAKSKFIPEDYEGSADFLSGLFDTDGCVTTRGIEFGVASHQLAKDVQRNLRYFGIQASLRHKRTTAQNDFIGEAWVVAFRTQSALLHFHTSIGFKLPRKQHRLEALLARPIGRRNSSRLEAVPPEWRQLICRVGRGSTNKKGAHGPYRKCADIGADIDNTYWTSKDKLRKVAEVLGRPDLHRLTHENVCWEEIASIEPLGLQPIAEIEVTGNHTYICEGFISHNTTTGTRANALWQVCRSKGHLATVAIFNAKEDNAKKWLRTIKHTIESNPTFRLLYGEMLPPGIGAGDNRPRPKSWKWSDHEIEFVRDFPAPPEASITALGIQGASTGGHWSHIIKDDIIGLEESLSEAAMSAAVAWADSARDLESPAQDGNDLWVYTTWHYADVYRHRDEKWGDEYVIFKRPALELDPLGNEVSSFPQKWTTDKLKRMRAVDPYHYAAQYDLNPRPGKAQALDEGWAKSCIAYTHAQYPIIRIIDDHYSPTHHKRIVDDPTLEAPQLIPLPALEKALLWDPAPSEGELAATDVTRSRNGMCLVGRDAFERDFILQAEGTLLDPLETIRRAIRMCIAWSCSKVVVEEVNFAKLYKHFVDYILRAEFPSVNLIFYPVPHPKAQKDMRIQSLIPDLKGGHLYLNETLCTPIRREMREYLPGQKKGIDCLDALAMKDLPGVLPRPQTTSELFHHQLQQERTRRTPNGRDRAYDAIHWGT